MIFFAVALLYGLTSGSAIDLMGEAIGKGSTVACAAADGGQYRVFGSVQFGGGPLGAFKCKVQEKITALDSAYRNIAQENKPTELWTSVCFSLFGAPVWCGDWDEERHMEVEIAHYTATRIVSLLMPLHAQYVLAEYLQKNMLSVFLPIGLLLRILPFTRGIGGLFIALSVGFFFIFPTFFILTDPTYVRADERLQDRIGGICYSGFKGATVLVYNIFNLQGSSGAGSLASARGADLVYQVSIATVFYPFIALVLTLAFVRALTPTKTNESYLQKIVFEGAKQKYGELLPEEVKTRLDYELDIICSKGYAPYFIMLADIVSGAHSLGAITNTRGSAAGSLVGYVLKIITVDPLEFNIPFERFLTKHRPSPPDIDLDISDTHRDATIAWITEHYGKDKVARFV
jgi:hypothetical protein